MLFIELALIVHQVHVHFISSWSASLAPLQLLFRAQTMVAIEVLSSPFFPDEGMRLDVPACAHAGAYNCHSPSTFSQMTPRLNDVAKDHGAVVSVHGTMDKVSISRILSHCI